MSAVSGAFRLLLLRDYARSGFSDALAVTLGILRSILDAFDFAMLFTRDVSYPFPAWNCPRRLSQYRKRGDERVVFGS